MLPFTHLPDRKNLTKTLTLLWRACTKINETAYADQVLLIGVHCKKHYINVKIQYNTDQLKG